jgi:hypothetical protein
MDLLEKRVMFVSGNEREEKMTVEVNNKLVL